ncbi:hypothetical protein SAMN04324258_0163 [Krasilnikoviella flava]|uniref:Uncharacterized protein n=1 Tax=Krasilnikoviella flava TaxID=526729 RepID=A0A1T5I8X8_9MICO|nr:hypothetical protein SAMN04324258_0163 [Krasilnikoviella flava]
MVPRTWREVDASWHFCHSWQKCNARMITAMTLLLILALLLVAAYAATLVRTVRRDGLGTRRPPRSHPDWWDHALT